MRAKRTHTDEPKLRETVTVQKAGLDGGRRDRENHMILEGTQMAMERKCSSIKAKYRRMFEIERKETRDAKIPVVRDVSKP